MTIDDITALAKATRAPLQRVDVYERHCGDPSCQCHSTVEVNDDDGLWVRTADVTTLEETVDQYARAWLAVMESMSLFDDSSDVCKPVIDQLRAAIAHRLGEP